MKTEVIRILEGIEKYLEEIAINTSAIPRIPFSARATTRLEDFLVGSAPGTIGSYKYRPGKRYKIIEGWQGHGLKNEHLGKIYILSKVSLPAPPSVTDASCVFEFWKRDNPELEHDLKFYNDLTDIELAKEDK